jgi:glycosyltransferase involved in cell wall biosynthesis
MKILAICARIPSLNKNGDQVLSYNRLKYLSKSNSIHVICFSGVKDISNEKLDLESLGIRVSIVKWHFYEALWFILTAFFDGETPFQCAYFHSYFYQKIYLKLLNEFNPDVIYAITIRPMCNAVPLNKPLIIDLVDSMGLNFSRRIKTSFFIKKILLKVEAKRVSRYEKLVVKKAKKAFLVSDLDREYIGIKEVNVLPLGIDLEHFSKLKFVKKLPIVIFSGNMFYQPNIDAIVWFVRNCWPKVIKFMPEVRLVIAGGGATSEVLSLSSYKGVEVIGRVSSMSMSINSAKVAIAPMQSGSGMQFKILEAMACAVPVVTTKIGIGDIKAVLNEEILVASNSDEMADHVIHLLREDAFREKLGDAGHEYILKNHQWNQINQKFARICGLPGSPKNKSEEIKQ